MIKLDKKPSKWVDYRIKRAMSFIGLPVRLRDRPHIEGVIKDVVAKPNLTMREMMKVIKYKVMFKDVLTDRPLLVERKALYFGHLT